MVRSLYQTILGASARLRRMELLDRSRAPVNSSGAVLFNQMADGFYTSPEFRDSAWKVLNIYRRSETRFPFSLSGTPP